MFNYMDEYLQRKTLDAPCCFPSSLNLLEGFPVCRSSPAGNGTVEKHTCSDLTIPNCTEPARCERVAHLALFYTQQYNVMSPAIMFCLYCKLKPSGGSFI